MSDLTNLSSPLSKIEAEKNAREKIIEAPKKTHEQPASPENEGRFSIGQIENEKEIAKIKEQLSGSRAVGPAATADYFNQQHLARQKDIEKILAEDLQDIYAKLDPDTRTKFKNTGEQTAIEINNLLDKAKFKAKEIVALIKKWLFMIPGLNRFFLEQEVKIKTDKIVKLRHEKIK